jgi:hypothetical protein
MSFGRWLDRIEGQACSGDERSRLILTFTDRALLDRIREIHLAGLKSRT